MSPYELLTILALPLAVSCGPILMCLGAIKAWQMLSGDKDTSSVPYWVEASDRS